MATSVVWVVEGIRRYDLLQTYELASFIGTGAKIAARHIRSKIVLSDSQLIARSKSGDNEAFSELVRRYQNFVYRVAWGYVQDDDTAKDVVQEVFIRAWEALPYLRSDVLFRRWLYQICRNLCLNIIRRRKLKTSVQSESVAAISPDVALQVKLRQMVSRLDEEYREVIILRYYQDLKYGQIADVLNIPISTVKIRLFRARKTLKRMLGEKKNEM